MNIRGIILLFLFSAIASAQSLVFESHPGCFSGPRRSTIVASVESDPVLFYYNGDGSKSQPVKVGTADQSKALINRLLALELSKEEIRLIEDQGLYIVGPASFELKMTLGDRVWKVSYPAFLTNLTPEQKKIFKYDDATLAGIGKIEKIHRIVSELLPAVAQ